MPAPNQRTYVPPDTTRTTVPPDSTRTYARRTTPKKRGLVEQAYHDITTGFPELQRQMGAAVEKVKEGFWKVKRFLDK